MIAGASAFALARPSPNATMMQPYGADAPFGVGYVDGFGEHTPDPTTKPDGTAARSKRPPAGAIASTTPKPSPTSSSPRSPSPSPSTAVSPSTVVITPSGGTRLSAVYWTTTWRSNYDAYVWVNNDGTTDAAWEVRIKLPPGTTISTTMAAQKSYADGTWTFKPTRGRMLPGGRVYLFAFSGTKPSGGFGLRSCAVNGKACRPFS